MVGTAGGRRAVLAIAFCGAGYLAVSLLRIGRDSAGSGGFFTGGDAPVEGSAPDQLVGGSESAMTRIAPTVVLEPQAFAGVKLAVVDADHAPLQGIRARLEGPAEGERHFDATAESDSSGLLSFQEVADALPLSLAIGGEHEWVRRTLTLAPLSPGEVRDLGPCVLQRGLVVKGFVVADDGGTVEASHVRLTQPLSPLERRMNLGLAEPSTSSSQTTGVDELGRFQFE